MLEKPHRFLYSDTECRALIHDNHSTLYCDDNITRLDLDFSCFANSEISKERRSEEHNWDSMEQISQNGVKTILSSIWFSWIPRILIIEMVFCYQSCSDLLWEKNVLVIEKKVWNSRLKADNLKKFWDHWNNLFKQWKIRTIFGNWIFF